MKADPMLKAVFRHSFVRYIICGGIAFVVEYVSFYILFFGAGLFLVAANTISFCLGLLVAFLLNRVWAFSSNEYSKKAIHQFSFYATLAVINLFLTLAIVSILRRLGVNPAVGKLIAMIITSSWNFLLLKTIIFKHKDPNES